MEFIVLIVLIGVTSSLLGKVIHAVAEHRKARLQLEKDYLERMLVDIEAIKQRLDQAATHPRERA